MKLKLLVVLVNTRLVLKHEEHLTHVLHNYKINLGLHYMLLFIFMLISLGVLAFYGIQQVAQAGWSQCYLE
jgi:hypothetical protein